MSRAGRGCFAGYANARRLSTQTKAGNLATVPSSGCSISDRRWVLRGAPVTRAARRGCARKLQARPVEKQVTPGIRPYARCHEGAPEFEEEAGATTCTGAVGATTGA